MGWARSMLALNLGDGSPFTSRCTNREGKSVQSGLHLTRVFARSSETATVMADHRLGTRNRRNQKHAHKEIGERKEKDPGFKKAEREQPIHKPKKAAVCKLTFLKQLLDSVRRKPQLNNLESFYIHIGDLLLVWKDSDGGHQYIPKLLEKKLGLLNEEKIIIGVWLGVGYLVTMSGRCGGLKIEIGACVVPIVASSTSRGIDHDLTAMLYPLLVSSVGIFVCFRTTLFATDFFEVKDVKEIEPALKKQLIIFTEVVTIRIAFVSFMALLSSFATFNLGTQKDVKSWLLFLYIAVGLWAGPVGEVHVTLSAFRGGQDALGVEQNKSQSPAAIDFYKTSTAWGKYDPVTARDLSSNFIFVETHVGKNRTLDLDSKLQEFNIAVNISTIIKVWTQEYPLDSLYFGNMFCNLKFEIIAFDVGWKDAEFVEDQVSRLSLEDKADFKRAVLLRALVKGFSGPV